MAGFGSAEAAHDDDGGRPNRSAHHQARARAQGRRARGSLRMDSRAHQAFPQRRPTPRTVRRGPSWNPPHWRTPPVAGNPCFLPAGRPPGLLPNRT